MTATLFLSLPKLPSPSIPISVKIPKPPNSLSSSASSYFLQNPNSSSLHPTINNNYINEEDNGNIENCNNNNNEPTNSEKNKIKMPTAPWMKGPLLLDSDVVIDLSKPKFNRKVSNFENNKSDRSLTEKVSGRMGKKAVKKLVQSIEKLQVGTDFTDTQKNCDDTQKNWSNTQRNWGDLGGGIRGGDSEESKLGQKKMMPWERSERRVLFRRLKKENVLSAAELSLDKKLLERLRGEASKMKKWVKVKKLGVTEAVVDEVHSIWANNELVMFKFDVPLCRNMDRAREIVEIKTGGLVVWRKNESLVAYRGCDYHLRRCFRKAYVRCTREREKQAFASITDRQKFEGIITSTTQNANDDTEPTKPFMDVNFWNNLMDRSLYEREGDRLLDGLGPRFIDWWHWKPLPVDGDLLPEVVPGFRPPYRFCLPKVRPQLADDELTYLRSLARSLPVHFVLGRNSKLQGLAAAILQLWEKSVIVKIAVKWGVQNTNNEVMASELKLLTGGVLLLRNKFFIILYRGKDFLPGTVANVVVNSEMKLQQWQLHEEDARVKAVGILDTKDKASNDTSIMGTLAEYEHIQTICFNTNLTASKTEVKIEAEKERLKKELRRQEHKLGILKLKINKAENVLMKLDFEWKPSEEEADLELLTEEERVCFRKMGLKMDKVLVLGRRGVFDGVIEGLHQHWKHRELVKVVTMQRKSLQVLYTARFLERESGGVLVSIDKLKEGHAIIIFRGKNYRRPIDFGDNLLDKKKALKRSLEMQRLGSMKFFAYQRDKEIADLKLKLAELEKKRDEWNLLKSY